MTSPANERRPAPASTGLPRSRAAAKQNKSREQRTSEAPLVPLLLPWAKALIDRATGRVPDYGSPEFEALPDSSPEKVAACVVAAECWRTYTDPAEVEWRLRIELATLRAEHEAAEEAEAYWSPDVVAAVHRVGSRPSYAELSRRRGETERAARADAQRRRLGLPVPIEADRAGYYEVDPAGHAPMNHIDGRPVRYRAPLRAVPDGG